MSSVETRPTIDAPPLDYELDAELTIPALALADFDDECDDVPNPAAAGAWMVGLFLATVIIAAALIWRSL
jgi:hypothetical protein